MKKSIFVSFKALIDRLRFSESKWQNLILVMFPIKLFLNVLLCSITGKTMQHGEKEKESETAKLKNNRPMDRYCILNFQPFY